MLLLIGIVGIVVGAAFCCLSVVDTVAVVGGVSVVAVAVAVVDLCVCP